MNKDPQVLRIGVLGCGPISQIAHFDACHKARNVELYAICDVAADLVAKMAQRHQPAKTYLEYDHMLQDPRVDAVIVAVADQFHIPLCRRAVEAGKHVFVEKPLGVSVEECEVLRDAVRSRRVVFQVGNNRRFDPGVAFGHNFVREELGSMLSFRAWYYDSKYRYTMTDNLQPIPVLSAGAQRPTGNPKADKNRYFLLTHGSHLVDTARYLAGEIVSIEARFREHANSYCWFADVEFASGALGHLDLTIPICGDFEEGFRIQGEQGSVNGRVFLPWFHKAGDVECFSAKDRCYHRPLGEDAYTYKLQLEAFADTILKGVPQRGAGIDDGVAAVRAMAAIARSVMIGERVKLAEVTGMI